MGNAEVLLVLEVPVPFAHRNRIAELASKYRIPTMFPGGQADAGGIITYGTGVADTWKLMSAQADKILKGAAPGNLPVQIVTRRELVFNLKNARELGIEIPPDVLSRADRVISIIQPFCWKPRLIAIRVSDASTQSCAAALASPLTAHPSRPRSHRRRSTN
jgi:hypothetical protein